MTTRSAVLLALLLLLPNCRAGSRTWGRKIATNDKHVQRSLTELGETLAKKPVVTDEDLADVLWWFRTAFGAKAALALSRYPDHRVTMPLVLAEFDQSLAPRLPQVYPRARSGPIEYTRVACLVYFRELGDRAGAAVPSVIKLFERGIEHGEHIGGGRFMQGVVVAIAGGNLAHVLDWGRHGSAGVRREVADLIAYVAGHDGAIGEFLSGMIQDADDRVVEACANTMLKRRWCDRAAILRLRSRLDSAQSPSTREHLVDLLRLLEETCK